MAVRLNGTTRDNGRANGTSAKPKVRQGGWQDVEERKYTTPPLNWERAIVSGGAGAFGSGGLGSMMLPTPSAFGAGIDAFEMRSMPLNSAGGFGSFTSPVIRVGLNLSDAQRVTRPYEQNAWIRAGIKAIAGGFVQTRPRIFDRDHEEDDAVALDVPDLERLLMKPNPAMSRRRFMRAIATDIKLTGESFLFLQDKDGAPMKVGADGTFVAWPDRVVPASGKLVQHIVDKETGMPESYRYRTDARVSKGDAGYSVAFPVESVVAIIDYDPTYIIRGLGDVQALAREISLYFDTLRYLESSVRSGGQPGGFIVHNQRLGPDEMMVRQELLNDELIGNDTGQKYKILDQSATFIPNPTKPKDMAYMSMMEWTRQTILSVLGVPPVVVGLFEDATMNNVDAGYRELWRGPNGILTLAAEIDDSFTTQLVRRCSSLDRRLETATFHFDSSHVKVLREDRTEQVHVAAKIAALGVGISTNAALTAQGVEAEIDGGDFSSTSSDTPKAVPATNQGRSDRVVDEFVEEEDLTFEPTAPPDGGTPALRSAILGWLTEYVAAAVAKVTRAAKKTRSASGILTRSLDEIFDPSDMTAIEWDELLLSDQEWIERMSAAVGAPLQEIYETALAQALLDLPDAPIVSMSDPGVFKALTLQEVRLTEGVTSRASQRVRRAILEALASPGGDPAAGLSMRERIRAVLPELTPKLEKVFGTLEARAATIAQTEYGKADGSARMEQYRAGGVTEIQWFTSRDSKVRASHKPLHGEKVPIGARFSNGLRFPLDPSGEASDVVNCRCTYRPSKRRKPDTTEDQ